MGRRKRTEKETLLNQSIQLLNISRAIGNQGVEFKDFCNDIPAVLHTNKLDAFWLTKANKQAFTDFSIESEKLEIFGAKILKDLSHPGSVKSLNKVYTQWRTQRPHSFCETFQLLRKDVDHPYEWYFSVKLKLNEEESISLTQPVNNLEYVSNTLDKLFKHQPWLDSKALLFNLLTTREVEILRLITDGYSAYQISEILCISMHTVKTHRRNYWNKLEVKNIAELIRIADYYL